MDWTPYQREQIIRSYAHEGVAFCPNCHKPLAPVSDTRSGSDGIGTNLHCRGCGRQLMSSTAVPVGVTWNWSLTSERSFA